MKLKTHLAILIWMILGSAVMVNQVAQPIAMIEPNVDVTQSDDNESTDSDKELYVLQANVAINSFSPVTLNQELHQIREIILDEVADPQEFHIGLQRTDSDHFRALYSQLISPNAP
jgi:hypothetical protein